MWIGWTGSCSSWDEDCSHQAHMNKPYGWSTSRKTHLSTAILILYFGVLIFSYSSYSSKVTQYTVKCIYTWVISCILQSSELFFILLESFCCNLSIRSCNACSVSILGEKKTHYKQNDGNNVEANVLIDTLSCCKLRKGHSDMIVIHFSFGRSYQNTLQT